MDTFLRKLKYRRRLQIIASGSWPTPSRGKRIDLIISTRSYNRHLFYKLHRLPLRVHIDCCFWLHRLSLRVHIDCCFWLHRLPLRVHIDCCFWLHRLPFWDAHRLHIGYILKVVQFKLQFAGFTSGRIWESTIFAIFRLPKTVSSLFIEAVLRNLI